MHTFVISLLSAALVCNGASALAVDRSHHLIRTAAPPKSHRGVAKEPEPNFHVVAERIGKTILRPGGSEATERIQALANIHPGDTVLELSAGLGRSGIELAKKYGAKVLLTDIDADRLEKAKALAEKLGLSDLVSVRRLDMFDIDGGLGPDANFDVAQTEASLTHHPRHRKEQFFNGVAKHTNKLILHEVYFKTDNDALQESTKRDLCQVLNIRFVPETCDMWRKLLVDGGFKVDHVLTGDLAVLNPLTVVRDEGVRGVAEIAFNLATEPYLRSRVLEAHRAMSKHARDLGWIAIVASNNGSNG